MNRIGKVVLPVLLICLAGCLAATGDTGTNWPTVRVAHSDIAGALDYIDFDVLFERILTEKYGIPTLPFYFKSDDLAMQAVVTGQCDIYVGAPKYGLIENLNKEGVYIRSFMQTCVLTYIPVVNKSKYQSWEDLDGHSIAVHSRGSGTEAQTVSAEKLYGIEFSEIQYIPGTEVRGIAMLNGQIDASFLGIFTARWLLEEAPGRFMLLPFQGITGSDDVLMARLEWLEENDELVRLIMKETLLMFRKVTADPFYVLDLRERYNLLPDLPPEQEGELLPFWTTAGPIGYRSLNGGGESAAALDLDFYSHQLEQKENLVLEDFWYLTPLNAVLNEIGRVSVIYDTIPGETLAD